MRGATIDGGNQMARELGRTVCTAVLAGLAFWTGCGLVVGDTQRVQCASAGDCAGCAVRKSDAAPWGAASWESCLAAQAEFLDKLQSVVNASFWGWVAKHPWQASGHAELARAVIENLGVHVVGP